MFNKFHQPAEAVCQGCNIFSTKYMSMLKKESFSNVEIVMNIGKNVRHFW